MMYNHRNISSDEISRRIVFLVVVSLQLLHLSSSYSLAIYYRERELRLKLHPATKLCGVSKSGDGATFTQETEGETETEFSIYENQDIISDENETLYDMNNYDKNKLLRKIPPPLQLYLRDSGLLRGSVDNLTRLIAGPAFYFEDPHCFPHFIRISEYPHTLAEITRTLMLKIFNTVSMKEKLESFSRISFHKEFYGTYPNQKADVMIKEDLLYMDSLDTEGEKNNTPLFIFIHGGAWGSGFPTMYRLLSLPFLERNYRVAILGYRVYPQGDMDDQIEDLTKAVEYFTDKYASLNSGSTERSKVILMGHSSGSQIAMLSALQGRIVGKVDAIIAMSGVYDLRVSLEKEIEEGLSYISPMLPACRGMLEKYSPVLLMEKLQSQEEEESKDVIAMKVLPPILLLHGEEDTIAFPSWSQKFHDLSKVIGVKCDLTILKGLGHQDTVLKTCLGGEIQSVIFNWLESNVY